MKANGIVRNRNRAYPVAVRAAIAAIESTMKVVKWRVRNFGSLTSLASVAYGDRQFYGSSRREERLLLTALTGWLPAVRSGRAQFPRLTLDPYFGDDVFFSPFYRSGYRSLKAHVILG